MIIHLNNGETLTPQLHQNNDYGWTISLMVHRVYAKGNMRQIWRQFVRPDFYRGVAGTAFAREPHVRRVGNYYHFEQSGGLDI